MESFRTHKKGKNSGNIYKVNQRLCFVSNIENIDPAGSGQHSPLLLKKRISEAKEYPPLLSSYISIVLNR